MKLELLQMYCEQVMCSSGADVWRTVSSRANDDFLNQTMIGISDQGPAAKRILQTIRFKQLSKYRCHVCVRVYVYVCFVHVRESVRVIMSVHMRFHTS